ncbi:molybdopterin molybdenumtransferase MoeA [Brucella endophytica]|uniref:Molybdopterin molybdenumtransferase n=1 Tax=Brucella endophytica TaxID=1963359 RepID=A0A916WCI6_9HYPH|nr:gephyrin-like molybdotransferase Glp [Brucella endophytica]GGA85698.1 molybdopterin molybdenumtransferase MoeA [Brucella endophytica]
MALLPVDEALARLLADATALGEETIPLMQAGGRVLARPVTARHTQPPFDASAMDGYALRGADVASVPVELTVIGESAAGKRFSGTVAPGEAVRIFTGAPVPDGADTVLIQENTERLSNDRVRVLASVAPGKNIRRAGLDFTKSETLLTPGRVLDAADLSLAAAANNAALAAIRQPKVAILATGNELVPPGGTLGPDQIIASNTVGIAEIVRRNGGVVCDLGIVPDKVERIEAAIGTAVEEGVDILVTSGGASVGDHDLVHAALSARGMELDFWKIAMRPGKPLMFGRLKTLRVLGLPGNPVSSLICAHLFLVPLVAALGGRAYKPDIRTARLESDLPANGSRRDHIRAQIIVGRDGALFASPLPQQDSSVLSALARADALIIREPHTAPARAGDPCQIYMIR